MGGAARTLSRLLACGLLLLALPAVAQRLRPDVDFRLLPQPQPVATGPRIEVIDFFFYPCPYCADLAPLVERWAKRQPEDVALRHVPVVRHDSWAPLAKIYYTLEALGEVGRLHLAVFRGYHADGLALGDEKVVAAWAAGQGLESEKFMAIYRSDDVRLRVERARRMTRDYDIQSTPSIVVDGRFLTSSSMTPGVGDVMPIVDGLVRLARQRRERGERP